MGLRPRVIGAGTPSTRGRLVSTAQTVARSTAGGILYEGSDREKHRGGWMTGATHRLADALRAAIEAGDYPPGAALPSAERLAEEHGVARATAQKA
ncbi:GntR family transcriptional regulator, partial [Luedemannella helvata]|uniref:GntR family transcriptional regulator n=1 Tax=Luedemannella helvata TaxID=349315 RepID=UPI003CD09E95